MIQKRCSLKFTTSVNKWEEYDKNHLKKLFKKLSLKELKKELSLENQILWREKLKEEDILLREPYNLNANRRAYLYEISIYYRISILKSLKKGEKLRLPEKKSLRTCIKEMIRPITGKTLSHMGKFPVEHGRKKIEKKAEPAGKMKCILVNEHDEMLYHFLNARKLNLLDDKKILIHFDAHSDMGTINEADLEEIIKIDDLQELKYWFSSIYYGLEKPKNLRTPITLATFIHYAVAKELVREIFWVIPDPVFSKYRLPANLDKNYILNIEEAKDFSIEKGYVKCTWAGINVYILRVNDLPVFTEDIILDIDMDYFINMDDCSDNFGCRGYRINTDEDLKYWYDIANVELEKGDVKPWIKPEEFVALLKEKNIYSPLAFLSLSPHFTHPYYHEMINNLTGLLGTPLNKLRPSGE